VKARGRLIAVCAVAAAVVAAAAVAAATSSASSTRAASTLKGAGSSFVAPLVSQWQQNYKRADISYNPVGSGAGIAAIQGRQVDFGASDAPMTPDEFSNCHGCVQIPWALSASSIMYNLNGVKNNLHITGPLLADIYLGNLTHWNDKRLRALNPGVSLPNEKITPVFRSDASGTTYNVTDYLTRVSPTFKRKIGRGTQVNFPTGVGGKGSSGVSAIIRQTNGAVGYADIAYALKNHLQFFNVKNRSGKFASPGLSGIAAAASTVKRVPAGNEMHIVNPPKSKPIAYPICTFTYVIIPLKTAKAADLKTFVTWAITSGQSFGPKLKFVPIPKVVRQADLKTLKKIKS
jgi:phosphate transport system substrate-binding protein